MKIFAPINVGELFDKISILEIKEKFANDPEKLKNVKNELAQLNELRPDVKDIPSHLFDELKEVNLKLWETEERIRFLESSKHFGDDFIFCARLIYFTNDQRASIKKKINELTSSDIVEEKIFRTKY